MKLILNDIFLGVIAVCLAGLWLFTLYAGVQIFWPVRTLELTEYSDAKPIEILNPVVRPGETLHYKLAYCKYTDIVSTVHRKFIDGQVITLTDTAGGFPKGCRTADVNTAVVPSTINAGRYYLDVVVEYKINPFKTEFVHYRTTYFKVIR